MRFNRALLTMLSGAFGFVATLEWPWSDYLLSQINLPIGGVAMLIVFAVFKPPKRTSSDKIVWQRLQEFDPIGTFLILGTVLCLLLPLQWGGITVSWGLPKVYRCLIAFGVLLLSFVAWQWRMGDRATVPLRIFQDRTVCAASLVSGFLVMSMYA